VLTRHGLPLAELEIGDVGSFPTFLVGPYVVKLFGELFSGATCHQTERSLGRLLRAHSEIPAPTLVADGALFEEGWPWPYLVLTRVSGTPWSKAGLDLAQQARVAGEVGRMVRRLHDLPPPTDPVWERDWLAELRATCVERQRRWKMLPARLIDQIDGYLATPAPDRRLVHADLHWHHLFVQHGRLTGIIDWGDAILADPYYELPALHFHTFGGDNHLLAAFLEGYRWEVGPDFAHRAMTMTLLYEFNVMNQLHRLVDLDSIATLEDLAQQLWTPAPLCRAQGHGDQGAPW
jgi:hygromycin-B 7''-O-kinase